MSNNYITLFSDQHLGKNPYFDIKIAVDASKEVIDKASQSVLPLILGGGDLFDKPLVSGYELDAFAEILEYADKKNVAMILIEGNHGYDKYWRSIINHYTKYKLNKNVFFVPEKAGVFKVNNVTIVGLPYGAELYDALELRKKNPDGLGIFLGHCDIIDATYDSGTKIANSGLSQLELQEILSRFDIAAFGHIHLGQFVHRSHRAFYIGALLQYNFGAIKQLERGYMTLDLIGLQTQRYPLVGGKWPKFEYLKFGQIDINRDYKNLFVKIFVNGNEPTKDDEIKMFFLDKGVSYIAIERLYDIEPVVRRTDIEINDDPRTMARKYITSKIRSKVNQEAYLAYHEEILKNIGV